VAILSHQLRHSQGLRFIDHHRLFRKHSIARRQPLTNVLKVHEVGGADQQQIKSAVLQQGVNAIKRLTGIDAKAVQIGQSRWCRIDVAHDSKLCVGVVELFYYV